MRLIEGVMGRRYEVDGLELPLETERRLEALGLTAGTKVRIMNKKKHGAMVVKIRGTRFAVGRSIAEHVSVEEVQGHV